MIDWSFRTLTLGAGFKYFYFHPHLGKMNHFDEHIFQIFSKPPTERKQFEEANAEIGLSQEVQKVAWEWGCSDRHIGARCENLWFMTCWAFLKLRSRTANLVMIWWIIYIQYIYILSFHKSILIHARLVCFPKRFIYTVRLHLKTSSLFASLFGGGPATHQPGPENEWSGTEPLKPWVGVKQVNDRSPKLYTLPETNSNISPEKWWVGLLLCNFLLKCSLLGGHNR